MVKLNFILQQLSSTPKIISSFAKLCPRAVTWDEHGKT